MGALVSRAWWLGQAACVLVVLTVLAALLAGCGSFGGEAESGPCSYGKLILVPVVCVRAEPTQYPDGTWSYRLSDLHGARLEPGSILVVARKSVRRVESVQQTGDQVRFATAAVPLTDVVKDGTIPLKAMVTPGSIKTVNQLLPPAPPPEPAQITPPPTQITPTPTPSQSSTSSVPAVSPVISASVTTVRDAYKGDCSAASASAGQGPKFEATISVSDGPVTVAYHWTLTSSTGSTTSIPDTLTFAGTGPQMQTVSYTVPVDQYAPGTVNTGQISLQVDSPSSAAAPEQPRFLIYCYPASVSPSTSTGVISPSASTGVSGVSFGSPVVRYQPANLLARVFPSLGCYQFNPSLGLGQDSFVVDLSAWCQVGAVKLTWKVHGELGDFLSGGAIRIANHQLQDSGLNTTRLRGQLRFDWILSAAVPQAMADLLSLDLPIRLFVQPLLAGDFPVFLAVDIHLHVGPEFASGQALHGYALVSFGEGQGLSIHLSKIDNPRGPSIFGLGLDPGIRHLLSLPTLSAWVDFPYLSLGDDYYSTGAWLWASPRMQVSIVPGHDPGLCARAETDASASVGIEFQLFGLRVPLSTKVFDHPLPPAASFPRSPECITS